MPVSKTTAPAEITFPDGLVGLPHLVHHTLTAVPDSTLFELVCVEDPAMGFILAPADDVKPGSTDGLKRRGLVEEGEWVLAILAVHGEPPAITANLAGPIAMKMESATARQLVVEDPDFPLQATVSEPV
jgi:hypothetical protein